jgi:maleamate amidohydrolase
MSKRVWDDFLTDRDREVFAASGYGALAGGGKRPALLIIDVNYNFCGDRREPILESIKRWRNSCGEDAWDGLVHIRKLIDVCRPKGIPIIYSTSLIRADGWDKGAWGFKNARASEDASSTVAQENMRDGNDIMDEIAPAPQDLVIPKYKPSVFFGTLLQGFLNDLGVDSLIAVGTTTSGCVRATVVDAFSNNLRCTVVEEACFDRSQASHALSLCDMHAKYADVVSMTNALTYIETIDATYNLPSGIAVK